jgi:SNF2 family DNA or RNA helicase
MQPSLQNIKLIFFRHFVPGYLNYIIFHGSKRTSNKNDLVSPSIVLTTYATVVADHEGLDVLGQMNWYRVVLDEGIPMHPFFQVQV